MQNLPDLSQLSPAQKDELIVVLWSKLQGVSAQLLVLQNKIVELQGRLALNSQNSSKPPSSDDLNKPKPKSLRPSGQHPSGGQKGHCGVTLRQVEVPDVIISHDVPARCEACQRALEAGAIAERRQIFDLPATLKHEVTEHRVMQANCTCGKVHKGKFPEDVGASVQYGPRIQALMVHLNQHQMLPLKRTAELASDLFGLPVSQASILNACASAGQRLSSTVTDIAKALQNAPVLHADETGLRVGKTLRWMHVAATQTLTWVACHTKRGKAAFGDMGILPHFSGTLIHDGLTSYRTLNCTHGLCNAHHLRELVYVAQELKQDWAADMIALLTYVNGQVRQSGPFSPERQEHIFYGYEEILSIADSLNPRAQASGQPGRVKQSKAANLIYRLREYVNDVWRFATDPGVPFTNNLAEQAVRMPKVKQKISGCFRTTKGADTFCVIRSYLATMHKQDANLFDSLVQTFQGNTPQPRF